MLSASFTQTECLFCLVLLLNDLRSLALSFDMHSDLGIWHLSKLFARLYQE